MEIAPQNNLSGGSQSEASGKLDAVFRVLPDQLFCLDVNGRVLSYQAGISSFWHLLPEQVVGRQIQDILPPAVEPNFSRAFQNALQTGNIVPLDFQMQLQDTLRWFEARLVPSAGSRLFAFVRDVTDRLKAVEQNQLNLQKLSALHSIDAAISSSFDLNVILSVILRQITGQLGVDAADILLLKEHTGKLEYAAGQGFFDLVAQRSSVMLGQGFAGKAALERRTVSIPTLDGLQTGFLFTPGLAREKFASYYAIPLIAKGRVNGVLELYHRSILHPADDWFEFLATLAGQTALAIDGAALFQDLQRSNIELTLAYDSAIESWARALELSGRESQEHAQRLARWTVQLAGALHVEDKDINDLHRGALLHDIGKLAIPESILKKPGPLDEREWEITRQHPRRGYEMLSSIRQLSAALDIPLHHHERWDGSGYPDGMRGEQIPLSARIFALVDVYDALTSARPYRPAWTDQAAREFIAGQSGILFDPKVTQVFLNTLDKYQ